MKNFFSLTVIALLLVALSVEDAAAQRFTKRKRYASVGVSVNAMNYFGDITPESDFTSLRFASTRPNIGINYTKRMFPRISFRGNFFWGRITGDDAKAASATEADNRPRNIRNLSFRNDIKELSGTVIVDLFQNRANYVRRPDFVPYGFVGIGVIHHNPKAYWDGGSNGGLDLAKGWYELQPLGTEGQNLSDANGRDYPEPYKKIQVVIPAGIGIRYKLDRNWDLSFEIGWRKTFTDYLDDVSSNYVLSDADLPSAKAAEMANRSFDRSVHAPGFQRGDKTDKDWYIVSGFNLTYILPTNVKSPKFR
jgi:hypothetical protein